MKKILLLILFFSASVTLITAQKTRKKTKKDVTEVEPKNYTSQAGFNAGSFMGLGPTYRYTMGKNAVQVTGLPIFTDGELFLNGSLGYIRSLVEAHNVDLALVVSGGFIYFGDTGGPGSSSQTLFGSGIGTQIEMKLFPVLNLEFRSGLGVFTDGSGEFFDNGAFVFSPSFGASIMYNFTPR